MYKIKQISNGQVSLDHIELMDSDNSSNAKVFLNLGGSLQTLSLNNKRIIIDLSPINYKATYASSVLFPFTNRLKNGAYTFEAIDYALNINQKEENNAIHGLVYNKTFKILSKETSEDFASLKIGFKETTKTKGFPFKYTLELTYTLTKNSLSLNVEIKNNDKKPFPFSVGWHPYFYSSDLYNSSLSLKSNKKLVFDNNMIPVSVKDISIAGEVQIKDRYFDDCYILNSKSVDFKTPDYHITLNSSSEENFLQVFTPSNPNAIAIEPKTGPSNSFNNKLGLAILNPNESYQISWSITLNDNE